MPAEKAKPAEEQTKVVEENTGVASSAMDTKQSVEGSSIGETLDPAMQVMALEEECREEAVNIHLLRIENKALEWELKQLLQLLPKDTDSLPATEKQPST